MRQASASPLLHAERSCRCLGLPITRPPEAGWRVLCPCDLDLFDDLAFGWHFPSAPSEEPLAQVMAIQASPSRLVPRPQTNGQMRPWAACTACNVANVGEFVSRCVPACLLNSCNACSALASHDPLWPGSHPTSRRWNFKSCAISTSLRSLACRKLLILDRRRQCRGLEARGMAGLQARRCRRLIVR